MLTYDQQWGSKPRRSHNLGYLPWNEANKVGIWSSQGSLILKKIIAWLLIFFRFLRSPSGSTMLARFIHVACGKKSSLWVAKRLDLKDVRRKTVLPISHLMLVG